jgi:hypothetical protein
MKKLLTYYVLTIKHCFISFFYLSILFLLTNNLDVDTLNEVIIFFIVVFILISVSFSVFHFIYRNKKSLNKKYAGVFIHIFILLYACFIMFFYKTFSKNLIPFQVLGLFLLIVGNLFSFQKT